MSKKVLKMYHIITYPKQKSDVFFSFTFASLDNKNRLMSSFYIELTDVEVFDDNDTLIDGLIKEKLYERGISREYDIELNWSKLYVDLEKSGIK